ncbi:ATPase, T2SS/T4P/T4SS family [Pontiella sulfatireligans]|uniref:Conjugal transfer protein n=1 Tax=Pontiella sulfatireligans TaxID=2750658 RepID=A0A6C2URD3_9BACT|nr:ATPase, T2SS/T4P/T4SS family [Pontiella sulfatireligans]VGO21496.1 Putative conjugal transfer protein [Pontiella sulfatireligans]
MNDKLQIQISHPSRDLQTLGAPYGAYMIGSDASCRIVLDDGSVEEAHAVLSLMEDESYVEDLMGGGVYVDGERVKTRQRVYRGAPIQMGNYTLLFGGEADLAPAPSAAAPEPKPVADAPEPFKTKPKNLNVAANQAVKQQIHSELVERLDLKRLSMSKLQEHELQDKIKNTLKEIIDEIHGRLPRGIDPARLAKEIFDEAVGLGPLEDLLADDSVTEIMVNGPSQVYVERAGKLILTDYSFINDASVNSVIDRIVSPIGRRIDESQPYVDARLADGSRVNAIIHPLSLIGPCLTIRKFSKVPFRVQDLINFGTLTKDSAEFMRICVLLKKNIIVSGGTGSGKTTLLNVLSSYLPDDERILTIEDAAELRLTQQHIIRLEARPANIEGRGAVTIRDLVRNALRMRPDRIVVGECRGSEALDMLQAMNTGHEGSLTTIHANTPRDTLARLETMVLMAGMDLPIRAIREQVGSAVHMICQISRFSDGTRKVSKITEVSGLEGDRITLQDLFEFVQTGVGEDGKVFGTLQPTGAVPTFIEEISIRRLPFDRAIFDTSKQHAAPTNRWGK